MRLEELERLVVERPFLDGVELHDAEVGREVEVARQDEPRMGAADARSIREEPIRLLLADAAREDGQDRIAHTEEGLRNQAGADDRARVALAGEEGLAAPARGQEVERRQIAAEVHELAPVVAVPDVRDDFLDHPLAVGVGEAIRPADAHVVVHVFAEGNREHAMVEVGFDDQVSSFVTVQVPIAGAGVLTQRAVADVDARMRPGALRHVLDDLGDARLALDQQHVAGPDVLLQVLEVVGNPALVAPHLLVEEPDQDVGKRALDPQGSPPSEVDPYPSLVTSTRRFAVTSGWSLIATSCSPSFLIGSSSWTLRLSMSTPLPRRKSPMSPDVTEP